MSPALTLDADALAAMLLRRGRDSATLRIRRIRLDSDGVTIPVELPGPAYLARLLALPGADAFRRGSVIVHRTQGSADPLVPVQPSAFASVVRELISTLPARPDASEAYKDLVLAATHTSPAFGQYLEAVIRSLRDSLPTVPALVTPKARSAEVVTHAEYMRARREAKRAEDEATVRHVLSRWAESGALTIGEHLAPVLYESACSAIERTVQAGRTMPDGKPLSDCVGSHLFYRVADEVLGGRRRRARGYVYTVRSEAAAA